MHYIEVYFCQQSEFGDSADSSSKYRKCSCFVGSYKKRKSIQCGLTFFVTYKLLVYCWPDLLFVITFPQIGVCVVAFLRYIRGS